MLQIGMSFIPYIFWKMSQRDLIPLKQCSGLKRNVVYPVCSQESNCLHSLDGLKFLDIFFSLHIFKNSPDIIEEVRYLFRDGAIHLIRINSGNGRPWSRHFNEYISDNISLGRPRLKWSRHFNEYIAISISLERV